MLRAGKMSARIVATIFALAMTYASFCSTTCALGMCPHSEQHSPGHDCDNPSHPTGPHHGSGKSDCSAHYHPNANLVKPDGLQQLAGPAQVSVDGLIVDAARLNLDEFSSLRVGSPPTPISPLYQRISVLRI